MERILDPLWEETNAEEPAPYLQHLADNRITLDVVPNGCRFFLQLTNDPRCHLELVEFLRLNTNDVLIPQALNVLPRYTGLKSLVLKGGHDFDENGKTKSGLLSSLPSELCSLSNLQHLDLSFNSLTELPLCVTSLSCLSSLLLCYNQIRTLPDTISNLRNLELLSIMSNQLAVLPGEIGQLGKLKTLDLSENKLACLPEDIAGLQECTELDLSGNCLTELPETMCQLVSLQQLHLHSNLLVSVPVGLAVLPSLKCLDLKNNQLRYVPEEIMNCPCVRLQGNPIGVAEPTPSTDDHVPVLKSKEIYLSSEDKSFLVTPDGGRVFLPLGPQFCFPLGAVSSNVTIYFRILPPDQEHVKLGHHDVLLSYTLELQPHDIQFNQDVEICIPYFVKRSMRKRKVGKIIADIVAEDSLDVPNILVTPRTLRKREVVIRTYSGENWTDLATTICTKRNLAICRVPHFSWFFVVSRLVKDQCQVPKDGEVLFSSVDQNIRIDFPPGATEETRTISMQVLPVSTADLQRITGDSQSTTSPLLCLSQSSSDNFLCPVKIQLPLPTGVTGDTLDRSRLVLLHGDPQAQNWTDITSQVVFEITHIYARFQVDHFSWYWLWYTTKTYIGEMAKNVYTRLRMYQVNFVALQRKRDPEQVLLQCVPKQKVDTTMKKLKDRYKGPEPSDMVEIVEGEQFFAEFEQGLQLHSERPDCVNGKIVFVFYSRMKNIKEVYMTSQADRKEKDVKGQVSFYRGSVPAGLPKEATKHRKGPNSHWMATLPLKLPKLKLQYGENEMGKNGQSLPPLNLGNAETGYLTETNLSSIARRIGHEWKTIGRNLGLSTGELDRISYNKRDNLDEQIFDMLFSWARKIYDQQDCVQRLIEAMQESGRQDIAEEIEAVIKLGKQKYEQSILRLGLDQGNSSEDSAIAMSQS
ncbi:p53-induced death domain-containing protein 1 isoform X2 [Xenopus laevis]|uniref:P53-induced death domain-containing protein 1 isoform X2 n=1 Tax=Xenopus laevis TaxID=8355 RepID=A0A8J0UZK4_XENLA|nr:p53-induced death domain-containing protein 1 isoform X2 [Xenopus laevis]